MRKRENETDRVQEISRELSEGMVGSSEELSVAEQLRAAQLERERILKALSHALETADLALEWAERTTNSRNRFFAEMSQEVRSTINGLLGLVDQVLGDDVSPAQRQRLEMLRSTGRNLLVLVNQMLNFSRLESGVLGLEFTPFSLPALIRDTFAPHASCLEDRGVKAGLVIASDLPEQWLGDPDRLRQILDNLLENAVTATERGRVDLSVVRGGLIPRRRRGDRPVGDDEGKKLLHFCLRDTGPGIDPEKLSWIFESFRRESGSGSARPGGAGLGLTICRQMVELMGGKIWVENHRESGCSFHFTLPLTPS